MARQIRGVYDSNQQHPASLAVGLHLLTLTPRGFLFSSPSVMLDKIYSKPHATLDEQITKLRSRGLLILDEEKARHYLSIVGYYRLSSYCYWLERPPVNGRRSHSFLQGCKFDDVIRLYVFDQKFRSLMLEALERFEISARSAWAYELSRLHGPHAFMEPSFFVDRKEHTRNLLALFDETSRAVKTSEEVDHYVNTYSAPELPPVWTLVSLMSFGELFRWIKNTNSTPIKLEVARMFGIPNIQLFEGVAKSLGTVRNICAHHGRLWDLRLVTRMPYIEKRLKVPMVASEMKGQREADHRMYNCIAILAHILLTLNNDSTWPQRIKGLVLKNLTEREQSIMGFPNDWLSIPFWKDL